jgi:hypothetical protein
VEGLVLGRATQLARDALGPEVGAIRAADPRPDGHRFRQSFEAGGDGGPRVLGEHVLGFTGDGGARALLCTVLCRERAEATECAAIVGNLDAGGAWTAEPAPSLLVRGVLLAAERPAEALGAAGIAAVALVWAILARRPRTRVP